MTNTIFDLSLTELVDCAAFRADSTQEYLRAVGEIHQMMRINYKELIHHVGRNVFPVIIAQDDAPGLEGVGGTYTLFLSNENVRSITPVPPQYAMLKSLSHMPLGIFTILGPSLKNPQGFSWVQKLKPYAAKVAYALSALEHADLTGAMRQRCRDMLSITHDFVTGVLSRKSLHLDEYSNYTAQMLPFIHLNLDDAARLQARAVTEAISAWKRELGPKLWRQLYVVIPTVWPVSRESPRQQIFRKLMDPGEVDNRLLIGEGVRSIEEARSLLGRIVADRLVGRLVFTLDGEKNRALTAALSSPKDIVADSARQALSELSSCPMAKQHARRARDAGMFSAASLADDPLVDLDSDRCQGAVAGA